MKTILITGGAGFLGSHLSHALLEKGYRVMVLDDLSHGDMGNISDTIPSPKFSFYRGDVLDKNFLIEISEGVDIIVHFATYKIQEKEAS